MRRRHEPSKDSLQKTPLGKLSFFAYVISQKWSANQQKQLCNDTFHVKTSQSAKISSILQKKIGQKAIYALFAQKPSITEKRVLSAIDHMNGIESNQQLTLCMTFSQNVTSLYASAISKN